MMLSDRGEAIGTSLLMFSFLSGQFQLWTCTRGCAEGLLHGAARPCCDAAITMLVRIRTASGPTALSRWRFRWRGSLRRC